MKKGNKGITLVALIITIIVLLILAVVSIQAVTGRGLFSKTSDAVEKYQNSTEKENSIMDNHIDIIDSFLGGNKSQEQNQDKDPIVGTYIDDYGDGETYTVVFEANGAFHYYSALDPSKNRDGTWTNNQDGTYTSTAGKVTMTYSIDSEGNVEEFDGKDTSTYIKQ